MAISEEWMTISEAAALSGYHPERVRELVREKKISAQKFGSVWAVYRKSLLEYQRMMQDGKGKRGPKPKFVRQ